MGLRASSTPFPRIQLVSSLARFPAQQYLYQQGEPSSTGFVIRSGIASLEPVAAQPRSDPGRHEGTIPGFGVAVSHLLQDITKFRVELHRASARQRVLLLLGQLKKAHCPEATSLWLPSRQEMADTLDINHVTASRVVAHLYRENVLLRGPRSDEVGVDWCKVHRLLHTEQRACQC